MKKLVFFLLFLGFIAGPLFSYSFQVARISLLDIGLGLFVLGNLQVLLRHRGGEVFFVKTVGPFLVIGFLALILQSFKLTLSEIGISKGTFSFETIPWKTIILFK